MSNYWEKSLRNCERAIERARGIPVTRSPNGRVLKRRKPMSDEWIETLKHRKAYLLKKLRDSK